MIWQKTILKIRKSIKYLKQERGAIFVLTALLLPVLFGFMGIAYDVGNLYMHKARLQNVTDAAALAGGAIYKERTDQGTDEKTGLTITLKGNHVLADNAATDYISKNKINLGNDITIEELSALVSSPTSTTSGNITTEKTDVYYRVIAKETVPLNFIPFIVDKRTQDIRTVSVAITETTKTITHGTGTGTTTKNRTLLDTLFTVENYLYLPNKYKNDDFAGTTQIDNTVTSTFDGDIIYTNPSATLNWRENYELLREMLPEEASHGVIKRALELIDQSHYSEQNGSVSITSPAYINAFKSPFYGSDGVTLKSSAIPLTPLTGDVIKTSEMNTKMLAEQANSKEGNVFYDFHNTDGARVLVIDQPLAASLNGKMTKPVYFMFNSAAGRNVCKIQVKCQMQRPIVIVWLQGGSENLKFENSNGGKFCGTIYVPYKRVEAQNLYNFSFYGNIIAKGIDIQGDNQNYHMVNYLKDEDDFKNLPQLSSSGSHITQAQYNTAFSKALNDIIEGTDQDRAWISKDVYNWIKAHLADTDFGSITNDEKSNIIKAWAKVYEKTLSNLATTYSNQNFQLSDLNKINRFQWDNYDPSENEEEGNAEDDVKTNSTLRLINPRTEINPYFAPNSNI